MWAISFGTSHNSAASGQLYGCLRGITQQEHLETLMAITGINIVHESDIELIQHQQRTRFHGAHAQFCLVQSDTYIYTHISLTSVLSAFNSLPVGCSNPPSPRRLFIDAFSTTTSQRRLFHDDFFSLMPSSRRLLLIDDFSSAHFYRRLLHDDDSSMTTPP
jgi:hypothetical protein